MGNQQPNGKKDDKDKEKKKYEAPIPTRVGKKKRVKVSKGFVKIFNHLNWNPVFVLNDELRGPIWLISCQKSSHIQSADLDF